VALSTRRWNFIPFPLMNSNGSFSTTAAAAAAAADSDKYVVPVSSCVRKIHVFFPLYFTLHAFFLLISRSAPPVPAMALGSE
jgi:hypothetical protein